MAYLPNDCLLRASGNNFLEQWCYSNISTNDSSHYIEEIKKEKRFIYEVTHVCKDVDLQITQGLSPARDFIPAVKISIIPFGNMGRMEITRTSRSFTEMLHASRTVSELLLYVS